MNFTEAEQLVTTARDKRSKPLQNNTRLEKRDDDTYAVRLHATDVVTFHRDGRVVLNTGGWFTYTTKERLGYASGLSVYSDKGQWYVEARAKNPEDPEPDYPFNEIAKPFQALDPGAEVPAHDHSESWCGFCSNFKSAQRSFAEYGEYIDKYDSLEEWERAYKERGREVRAARKLWREWRARNRYEFFDGITFQEQDGRMVCVNAQDPAVVQAHDREVKEMKAKISKYLKLVAKELRKGLPMPSGGDCWYCAMRSNVDDGGGHAPLGAGQTLGDLSTHDHLLSHMEEGYVVPSLLTNAMVERYQPTGVALLLHMDLGEGMMGGPRGGDYEPVIRALRQYLYTRLVPNAPPSTPAGAAFRHYEEAR